jgi:hypothetical protein
MEKSNISLASDANGEVKKDALYLVDFNRLTKVEDLVLIFAAIGLSFHSSHPYFEMIKPFLDLENPIQQGAPQQAPKPSELKLPKLKQL